MATKRKHSSTKDKPKKKNKSSGSSDELFDLLTSKQKEVAFQDMYKKVYVPDYIIHLT